MDKLVTLLGSNFLSAPSSLFSSLFLDCALVTVHRLWSLFVARNPCIFMLLVIESINIAQESAFVLVSEYTW